MRLRRLLETVPLLAVLCLIPACAGAALTPTPPYGLPPLVLPADESPHDFQAEWWYFNAHLASAGGRRFALHDVVFQVQQLASDRTLYVRQVGLAGGGLGHTTAERLRAAAAPLAAEPGDFEVSMGDWLMRGSRGERYELRANAGGYAYDLDLTSAAPPLSHGNRGLVDFGEAGVTYYYTRPRLDIAGVVTTPDGRAIEVSGLGWLDKQWGDFQPVDVEWDWASIQLDDGTDLMLSVLYDRGGAPLDEYATLRLPGAEPQTLGPDQFSFLPDEEEWRSARSGTVYRVRWRVELPGLGLSLRLRSLVRESEFVSSYLFVTYWESGVDVLDAAGAVVGQGFVELNWSRGRDR